MYPSLVVRRTLKISQRRLDYWDELGIVRPSVQQADGKGTMRLYSFEDLVKLRVIKSLRDLGLSLQKIRDALEHLARESSGDDPLLDDVLVTDGKTLYRQVHGCELADVLAGGQMVLSVVRMDLIRKETASIVRLEEGTAGNPQLPQHISGQGSRHTRFG